MEKKERDISEYVRLAIVGGKDFQDYDLSVKMF